MQIDSENSRILRCNESVIQKLIYIFFLLFLSIMLLYTHLYAGDEGEHNVKPFWIFFTDKGLVDYDAIEAEIAEYKTGLSDKTKRRRLRAGFDNIADWRDLNVNEEYISGLAVIEGASIREKSRWLNAVSADVNEETLEQIKNLPFVRNISPVRRFYREPHNDRSELIDENDLPDLPRRDYELDYGNSLRQNEFLNAPEMHDLGYSGRGVLVGLLDAGFNNLEHRCFAELDLVAAYDFVNDDDNVDDEDDLGSGAHGTKTLSITAAYDPESMIGMAYGASYVIAKTEVTDWERPVEEDYWVAGLEWMDELGVEIVSSSLSYMNWYDYDERDGETAVTTIAADRAADVGMVVIVSMGNTGRNRHPQNKMGCPADGFKTFGIGSVDRDSARSSFSSVGPTYDGRIKPDFTTLGSNVRYASPRDPNQYGAGLGTSFSAPAIAGLCALLLEANPYLNPHTLREVLREASNNSEEPDTLYGWGIPDGIAALGLALPDRVELLIPLETGWNIGSHNLAIAPLSMEEVFNEIAGQDEELLVKDAMGRFYYPAMNFNNIPFWDRFQGYQIKVSEDNELTFNGRPSAFNEPIDLIEGWQIVAYLPDFQMDAVTAFSGILEDGNLIIAKDSRGRFYLPEFDFNNIPSCRPGQGYQIKTRADGQFRYPRPRFEWEDFNNGLEPSDYFGSSVRSEFNMSLLLIAENGIADYDQIGCFDTEGELRGAATVKNGFAGIAVWGGSERELIADVRVYKPESGKTFPVDLDLISGELSYSPNGIAIAKASLDVAPNLALPREFEFSISPNPFNSVLNMRLAGNPGNYNLSIFDHTGRWLEDRRFTNHAGEAVFSLPMDNFGSGNYLVRISNGNRVSEIKAVLIK